MLSNGYKMRTSGEEAPLYFKVYKKQATLAKNSKCPNKKNERNKTMTDSPNYSSFDARKPNTEVRVKTKQRLVHDSPKSGVYKSKLNSNLKNTTSSSQKTKGKPIKRSCPASKETRSSVKEELKQKSIITQSTLKKAFKSKSTQRVVYADKIHHMKVFKHAPVSSSRPAEIP